jgi:hypothetical protein
MKEGTSPHAAPAWPGNTTRRARRRKESKVVYRTAPGYSTRRIPSPVSSPTDSSLHNEPYQPPPTVQTSNLGYVDTYFTLPERGARNQDLNFNNVVHQQGPSSTENSLFSFPSYTLGPNPPTSPHLMFDGNDSQSPISGPPQMYDQDWMWNGLPSGNGALTSSFEDMQMPDFHHGSFGSLDSSMGLSTPDTATSSMHSEDFVFPVVDPTFGPSGTTDQMPGLALPSKPLLLFPPTSPNNLHGCWCT